MARIASNRVLVIGICIAAIAGAMAIQLGGTEPKKNQQDRGKLSRDLSGRIEIAGSVEDQDGLEIEDFVVQVGDVKGSNTLGTMSKRKTESFGRDFRISRSGVSTIDCIFLKEGYYSERLSFSISEYKNGQQQKDLKKRNIVIVLQEIPEPAPLERYTGFLSTNSGGPQSVLFTRKLPLSEIPLSAEQIKERNRIDLSRPHIFLQPESGTDGLFSRVLMELEETTGSRTVLRRGTIGFSQPEHGDGFLAAGFADSKNLVVREFRRMTEAPTTGYDGSLAFTVDDGAVLRFFYCRIHGQYGKGVVSNIVPIISRNGFESVTVDIEIFLNPTGSRDVSFIHL